MDAALQSGEEKNVSEHNTNQNESLTFPRKEPSTVADPLQDIPLAGSATIQNFDLIPMEASTSDQDNQASATAKSETNFTLTIPIIEITHVDQNENPDTVSQENSQGIDTDLSANKCVSIAMEYLRPPVVDTTINIARPSCGDNLNVSRVLERSNDEDVEVVCRYSSTPVLSPDRSGRNMNDTDVSMLSINSASPIAPADISTPGRSNNQSLSSSQGIQDVSKEGKEFCRLDQNKYPNVLFDSNATSQQPEVRESLCRAPVMSHMSHASFGDSGSGNALNKHNYSCSDAIASASYSAGHSASYFPCLQSTAGYTDYHGRRGASWPDLAYRSDLSPGTPPLASMTDPCCFALDGGIAGAGSCMGGVSPEAEYFVYPSIYVSSAGLISVLLRNDISVEMTVDRTIRVVSHNHMMAVATDSRGTAACLYHPAVKVFQMGNTTDIATQNFRAQMGGNDCIVFSNGMNYFRLEGAELQPTAPMKFIDILRDQSVNLLFSSEGYGEMLVAACMQVAGQAEYSNLPKGGVIVRINGVKVTQTGGGDVTVVTGAKFIRLSPSSGTTRLGNRFVDIEVEKDWTVKLTRGSHSFVYAKKRAMVCNGKIEAGFDENNGLKVNNLAPRHPFLAEPTMVRRPARKPVRPVPAPPPGVCCTPKRRFAPPTGFGGRWGAGGIGPT